MLRLLEGVWDRDAAVKVVRSEAHRSHFPRGELHDGEFVRPFECPERVEYINAALEAAGLDDVVELASGGGVLAPEILEAVHNTEYLVFLQTAWEQWTSVGRTSDMIPATFATRRMDPHSAVRIPKHIDGQLGWFAFAAETAITAGTWSAALGGAALARRAQQEVAGGVSSAFALCRPPGHHAASDSFGGYCFLNNAAVAAQGFLTDGAKRVAILDVDYHHGNGTQDIFYERSDVFVASLHADPAHAFPFFTGTAGETGIGKGAGYNVNFPLAPGTRFDAWFAALGDALARIVDFGPDALVVSLGVDTFEHDPISSFELSTGDFSTYGRAIGALGLPTVYCMEGGYAVEAIGTNTVNVLTGHLQMS